MEVHRQPGFLLERSNQQFSCARPADTGHVLDAQHMHAGFLELRGDTDVIAQRILRAGIIEDVTGVTNRPLA